MFRKVDFMFGKVDIILRSERPHLPKWLLHVSRSRHYLSKIDFMLRGDAPIFREVFSMFQKVDFMSWSGAIYVSKGLVDVPKSRLHGAGRLLHLPGRGAHVLKGAPHIGVASLDRHEGALTQSCLGLPWRKSPSRVRRGITQHVS
jgi:hypothetical protein